MIIDRLKEGSTLTADLTPSSYTNKLQSYPYWQTPRSLLAYVGKLDFHSTNFDPHVLSFLWMKNIVFWRFFTFTYASSGCKTKGFSTIYCCISLHSRCNQTWLISVGEYTLKPESTWLLFTWSQAPNSVVYFIERWYMMFWPIVHLCVSARFL